MERHDGIAYELVQALDAPVLQTVEQLPNVVQFFATFLPVVAEPVITVPKIVPHDVPARRLCRDTQLAEQLVEVPTTISVASLFMQRLVELGTPVPGVGGRNAGLHGLLHGQGSTATHSSEERISERIVEQIAFPSSEERISERIVEQIVDFTVACGDPQGFRPGQSSSSVARSPADWLDTEDEPGQGVFHTFPQNKKVRHNLRTRGRNCLRTRAHGRQLLFARPWCLRRRRRRSARRTLKWSTWSSTFACGGASGSQLASNIAGGWPLPMGPRLAIPYGCRRGSSAEGQGVVHGTTVDTWSASVPGASAVFILFSTRRRTEVVGLALWRVCESR